MFKKRAKGAEIILALVAEKARAGPEYTQFMQDFIPYIKGLEFLMVSKL